jgi:hypothetical protein
MGEGTARCSDMKLLQGNMDTRTYFKLTCQPSELCHVVFWYAFGDVSNKPAIPISTAGVEMRATDFSETSESNYHNVRSKS